MEERIIIVSNRLPYRIEKKNGRYELKQSSGGLVSAIKSISNKHKIVWVGAANFKEELWEDYKKSNISHEINIVPLFLNKKTENLYYNGFSNSVLWPLFHYFPSYTEYNCDYYRAYEEVNQQFAKTIKSIARANDLVWIHDYHLMLLPGYLKQEPHSVSSSFFLHIPFPSHELIRLIPENWRNNILNSLLCCDVIGFHTEEYVHHFKKSLEYFLGVHYHDDQLLVNGHLVKIKDYPISIDFNEFNTRANHPEIIKGKALIRQRYQQEKIIFSLDRLDYTKGVINRLQAFEQLLRSNINLHGKVILIINIIPSREEINKYAERKTDIEECISRINGVYGNFLWQPIVYQYQHLSFNELITCYVTCDVLLVTPLRDGMNLVAKEFVASRNDKSGSLILSEFAGAATELKGALLVNPNDITAIQTAIVKAFKMKPTEQEARMEDMQAHLKQHDVHAWANKYLNDMQQVMSENFSARSHQMSFDDKVQIAEAYQSAMSRLILLDYDGTLIRFYDKPQDAIPNQRIKETLSALAENPFNKVVIISGRDAATLNKWFGHLPIDIAAEHGLKYKKSESSTWVTLNKTQSLWKNKVIELFNRYTKDISGSFIEEKEHTVAWHYRMSDDVNIEELKTNLTKELLWLKQENEFDVLLGNKVLEVKSSAGNKGSFVKKLLDKEQYDFVLALGDDVTDEDMFAVLNKEHQYAIKVGLTATQARFNVLNVNVVLSFLEYLCVLKNSMKLVV
jgi:trehalose 6-phosphate synthase/phosphatase